ncbi:hypothetical protein F4604DRAFT_1933316 [Suillus subluteus]|nr:hypothetical protein F4604DRAFT_1933316 [Suillus subluteus]
MSPSSTLYSSILHHERYSIRPNFTFHRSHYLYHVLWLYSCPDLEVFPNLSKRQMAYESLAFLWALDTAQLALVTASIYHYTIVWQGDIAMLSHISKTFEASMGITSIIAFLVQLTYAYRIWRLSFGNIPVTFFIVLLALAALGSGGAMVIETVRDPLWDSTHLPASSFYLSSMACDFLIAATQVYLFHNSRIGRGRLGGLITKLTVLVVNVGLITTIDVTLFIILFLFCPRNGVFLVPYILMSHCYLNSFLSVLNSRLELRELADNNNYVPSIYTLASGLA